MNEPATENVTTLFDTCADAFEMLTSSGGVDKGCILKIYPATSDSQLLRLNREKTLIGRDPTCDVFVDDNAISRVHAAIEQMEGVYFLSDLKSTNGTYVDDELLNGRIPLTGGELIRVGGSIFKFMSSMDEEAHYHAVVHELMTRDSLTSAYNRSYVLPILEKELQKSRQTNTSVAAILLDIDHFKRINDQHGHLVGDEVLRIFSERVRQELRPNDMLCRFGGEEFLVTSTETGLKEVTRLAERIRLAVSSNLFQTQAGRITVTCSLGAASTESGNFSNGDALLSRADAQLYVSKKEGRNKVNVHQTATA